LRKASYEQKRKHCVVIVSATHSGISSANLSGSGSQWIHCSTEPTMKYMKSMHFMITRFSLFHFLWVIWPPSSQLTPLATHSV